MALAGSRAAIQFVAKLVFVDRQREFPLIELLDPRYLALHSISVGRPQFTHRGRPLQHGEDDRKPHEECPGELDRGRRSEQDR